jgi:putative addiction module killer protein
MFELRQTPGFARWLTSLTDRKGKARVLARLTAVSLGHFGDFKAVGNGVLELRIHFGPGYRVYMLQRGDDVVVLLAGGDKGSQARDIDKAIRLAKELEQG